MTTSPPQIAVLGTGGMGTALAILAARAGASVTLWGRDPAFAAIIASTRENTKHLPEVPIPETIRIESDCTRALADADLVIAAIPSAYLRATTEAIASRRAIASSSTPVPILSVVKGIEFATFARASEILHQTLGQRPLAVLSGPSHAEEIARGLPASVVVASDDQPLAARIQLWLSQESFRVYTNSDVVGVELAGALKNILGIAAGICEGLGFGDNAKAALLTRGLVEISRFAHARGAQPSTFLGLAGVGDVITTCYSPFGRNRALGWKIGQGDTLEEALEGSESVVEGVFTTRSVHALARKLGIDMPITAQVHAILFERKPPRATVSELMSRLPKMEWS